MGYRQNVCFCRVHGTVLSQTLPRKTQHDNTLVSSPELHAHFQRKGVMQNVVKGAFNTANAESIEDLTNRFNGIAHLVQDAELVSQAEQTSGEFPSYKTYDMVAHDVNVNGVCLEYARNAIDGGPVPQECSHVSYQKGLISPSYYNFCQENYYEPVSREEQLATPIRSNRTYIPQADAFRPHPKPPNDFGAIETRNNVVQKSSQIVPLSIDQRSRRRHNKHPYVRLDQQDCSTHHASENTRSAPSSPAQTTSRPRRRRRHHHSYRQTERRVKKCSPNFLSSR